MTAQTTPGTLGQDLPRPIGFVLGGGASSAAAQIGMLRALADRGISADLMVGTSAGALNGAVLADDPNGGLDRLDTIWSTLQRRSVIVDSRWRRMRNLSSRRHLYSDLGLRDLFACHIQSRTFEDLTTRFACVATDLDRGIPAVLHRGDLLDALLATTAIPGVFPCVRRDGHNLVDGLCVANIPVRQALDLGAASLVVLDGRPGLQPQRLRNDVRQVVAAAFAATVRHQADTDLEYARERVPVLQLPGQLLRRVAAFDFTQAATMIAYASRTAGDYLDASGFARCGAPRPARAIAR